VYDWIVRDFWTVVCENKRFLDLLWELTLSFCVSVSCCMFFFCDDHLFGGSRCGCSVKGTFRGWRAIVL